MKKLLAIVLSCLFIFSTAHARQSVQTAIPLPENLIGATLTEVGQNDDGDIYVIYAPATQEDFDYFLSLFSMAGIYKKELGDNVYTLFSPGSTFAGVTQFFSDGYILLVVPDDTMMLTDESFDAMIAYFTQPLALPTGKGNNILPEFYASVGRSQPLGQTIQDESIFGGIPCWREYYQDLSPDLLHKYIGEAILCGFDVWIDIVTTDENNNPDAFAIHLSNGDAEVILHYFTGTQNVSIVYKSGISYYLLRDAEYAQYIPQR